ncbi:MAG: hypothetical protein K2L35_02405, partial [Muribaculaceae bacterium]|nr:hypothetical protein [Muribaculaceae bacterium]
GYTDPDSDGANAYIYEIACWQNAMQRDSTVTDQATARIMEVSQAGNERYGVERPVFINNLVNAYVMEGDFDKAISTVNDLMAKYPDNSNLYGLQGFIYDRAGNDDASIKAYRAAAAMNDCDYETLKNAAKKFYRVGAVKFGEIDPTDAAAKNQIKADYYDAANQICQRAKAMQQDDPDLDHVIDAIDYALTTYFPAN